MYMFEKVTGVDLEILEDDEISAMIEELKNEKEKRYNLNKINAIDEILKTIDKKGNFLATALFTLKDGTDFYIDDLAYALKRYREKC